MCIRDRCMGCGVVKEGSTRHTPAREKYHPGQHNTTPSGPKSGSHTATATDSRTMHEDDENEDENRWMGCCGAKEALPPRGSRPARQSPPQNTTQGDGETEVDFFTAADDLTQAEDERSEVELGGPGEQELIYPGCLHDFKGRFPGPLDDSSLVHALWQAGGLNDGLDGKMREKVTRLRNSMADRRDVQDSEWLLVRYLYARDFKVAKAEPMLRDALYQMESLRCSGSVLRTSGVPTVMRQCFPSALCGISRAGSAVLYQRPGRMDTQGLLKSVSVRSLQRFVVWMITNSLSVCRNAGNLTPKRVQVMDLQGVGMDIRQIMPLLKPTLQLVDLVSPESVEKILIVNAPSFFPIIFAMCKPIMSARTQKKVSVCSSDAFEELSQVIDPSQLPVRYGGTYTGSSEFFDHDTTLTIPTELHLDDPVPDEGETCVDVSSTHQVEVNLQKDEVGSRLRWKLWSSAELGQGVYWKPAEMLGKKLEVGQMEELLPIQRLLCHQCQDIDYVVCSKPGVYVFVLDNSSSWFGKVSATYKIAVTR
eukprot:TRINITY_DN13307_c0_g1_i2.p1 TRINITY_DN13307_c0_g1~~TRINITY_DN13307_c0_g1_i2.p1  ORF type:complete len:535 (+),score=112.31 TRINITY_DN13307_c0_g1_i2:139-1743(+)